MKKIVALVLALALALSLCTVAFAATTLKVDGEKVVEKTAAGYVTRYVGKDTGKVYVTASYSNLRLNINGTDSEIYVEAATEANNYGKYTVSAKQVEAPEKADEKCGDVTNEDLFVAGGVYYAAVEYDEDNDDLVWLCVDGAVVCAEEYTLTLGDVVNHTVVAVYGDDGKVAGFTCAKCDATLSYTKNLSEALKAGVLYTTKTVGNKDYYVMYAAKAAATTAKTVDSSKTFDAGVAMYVGLSLMSVAGSAVVIGKKKEF